MREISFSGSFRLLPSGQKHQTLQFIAKLLRANELKVIQMETVSPPWLKTPSVVEFMAVQGEEVEM